MLESERYSFREGLGEKKRFHKLCSVFERIQEPFPLSLACRAFVSLSNKPCLHKELPGHNKATEKFPGGWGI